LKKATAFFKRHSAYALWQAANCGLDLDFIVNNRTLLRAAGVARSKNRSAIF